MTKHALLLTFALMISVQGAAAQAPPTATTPPPPTATASADDCAPNAKSAVVPRPNTGPGTTTGQAAEPLGDKLAKSDGVLCPPPGVDPEIRAPTPPDAGNMPVIPPPGSPSGNQNLRPK
jgi:hypothetical protein